MDEMTDLTRFRARLARPDAGARERVRIRTERLIAAGGPRRRLVSARPLVVLLVAAAVAIAAAIAGAAGGLLDLVGVAEQPNATVPTINGSRAHYLLGNQLFATPGKPQQLGQVSTGESAWPDAVPSRDGSKLIYEAPNEHGQPGRALRLHDLGSGADEELAADAFAPAWRADGMLAYGKTAHRKSTGGDVGAVFPARVEVRSKPGDAAGEWITTPGNYVPVAWAGRRLLVEQLAGDGASASLLALDAPEQARRLADGWLAALSPGGRLAAVSIGASNGRPSGPMIRLVDTVTGKVDATLDLRDASIDGLSWRALAATGPGDWTGTRIVLPAAGGVLVLSARANALAIDRIARFTGDTGIRGAEYQEARFLDLTGRQIIVKADVLAPSGNGQSRQSALVCDLEQNKCARGSDAGTPDHWLGLVANPSRPLR